MTSGGREAAERSRQPSSRIERRRARVRRRILEAAAELVHSRGIEAVTVEEITEAADIARRLAHHLWEHVDKEDSVLFPESAERLRRNGVTRLEGREPTEEEDAARGLGERLTERFPPLDDPEIVRGDGCIACSAFGETCGGIESEWWSTWEREYHRSLDEG